MSLAASLPTLVSAMLLAAALGAGTTYLLLQSVRQHMAAAYKSRLRVAEFFRTAAEDSHDGLAIHDTDFTILWANAAYLQMMGRTADEVIGHTLFDYAFPPGEAPSEAEMRVLLRKMKEGRGDRLRLYRNRRGDGSLFWNQVSMSFRSTSGHKPRVILACRDVTRMVEQEEALRHMRDRLAHEASHDMLTDLPNRNELRRFMAGALKQAAERGEQVAVLRIDLDRFKEINDTHGHEAGDETLINVAKNLRGALRDGDMVARVGGDEFVAACPSVPDLSALERLGRGLSASLSQSFRYNDLNLYPRASIGGALSHPGELDEREVLLQSDFALYEAKRTGRGRVVIYDENLNQRHSHIQNRSTDLRAAIGSGGLDHVFQPIVALDSGRITGFETLVRWQHAQDGIISPADFLPLAERLGLLGTIDLSSINAALTMKRQFAAAGFGQPVISFNASSDLLRHPSFINHLVLGTEAAGIKRSQIAIEVLETTVFTDQAERDSPIRIIRDLRDAGFNIYLDDFGMGYAGLAHLAELVITGIKLDRALVRRLLTNQTSAKIVSTIIDLCSDLGLRVIAEGVEDAATARHLHKLGCPHIQGYWLSPPLPGEEALDFMRSHNASSVMPGRLRNLNAG